MGEWKQESALKVFLVYLVYHPLSFPQRQSQLEEGPTRWFDLRGELHNFLKNLGGDNNFSQILSLYERLHSLFLQLSVIIKFIISVYRLVYDLL